MHVSYCAYKSRIMQNGSSATAATSAHGWSSHTHHPDHVRGVPMQGLSLPACFSDSSGSMAWGSPAAAVAGEPASGPAALHLPELLMQLTCLTSLQLTLVADADELQQHESSTCRHELQLATPFIQKPPEGALSGAPSCTRMSECPVPCMRSSAVSCLHLAQRGLYYKACLCAANICHITCLCGSLVMLVLLCNVLVPVTGSWRQHLLSDSVALELSSSAQQLRQLAILTQAVIRDSSISASAAWNSGATNMQVRCLKCRLHRRPKPRLCV
jgi:hypothetical protein